MARMLILYFIIILSFGGVMILGHTLGLQSDDGCTNRSWLECKRFTGLDCERCCPRTCNRECPEYAKNKCTHNCLARCEP